MMAAINNLLNKISNAGNIANSAINKIAGAFTSDDATPSSIRDKYSNGFFGDTTHFKPNVFARLFDEPTYLSFRIKFNLGYNIRNDVNSGSDNFYSYDYLPEPLLSMPLNPTVAPTKKTDMYSTYSYLKDALGETKRANMLLQLIKEIDDIQTNYPYYFTEIIGLGDLSKIVTDRGMRLDDKATIEIKCYESLDLKITQLMQLYRKIAWDDVYQRWILPDMMRYFNIKIYVSEIRLFHSMSRSLSDPTHGRIYDFTSAYGDMSNATSYDQFGNGNVLGGVNSLLNASSAISSRILGRDSAATSTLNTAGQVVDTATGVLYGYSSSLCRLCNNAINDVMPTICYDCHMCQFLVDDTLNGVNTLKSSKPEMQGATIKLSVGQLVETQSYPLNIGLTVENDKYSYQFNPQSTLMASAYIDDTTLMKEGTSSHDSSTYVGEKVNRINNTFMRMNDTLDYSDEAEDSYQIYNSSAATSTIAMIDAICRSFQDNSALSAATNNSEHAAFRGSAVVQGATTKSEATNADAKGKTEILAKYGAQEVQSTATDENIRDFTSLPTHSTNVEGELVNYYAGSSGRQQLMNSTGVKHTSVATDESVKNLTALPEPARPEIDKVEHSYSGKGNNKLIDDIDSISRSMATNKEITEPLRQEIVNLYKSNSVEDIIIATQTIRQIRDIVNANKQIEDLSQFDVVASRLKENVIASILKEMTMRKNSEGVNQAMAQFAEIVLKNSNAGHPATEARQAEVSGFSLLN